MIINKKRRDFLKFIIYSSFVLNGFKISNAEQKSQITKILSSPIFKKFIEQALYKEDMKPFKSPSNIYFFPIDYKTGQDVSFSNKKAIIEAFKEKTVKEIKVKNLSIGENYGKYNKFRRFY